MKNPVWAIGLMSGTSLDGIDAALVLTDGETVFERGAWEITPYSDELRHQLREVIYKRGDVPLAAKNMTLAHARAVKNLLAKANMKARDVALIGFHGQSIDHRPAEGITVQIGDGALLAQETGIDVITDFRRRDVAAGGQGAPLVPLFHAAMVRGQSLPVAVLNIGGMANVTWVNCTESGKQHKLAEFDVIAFDTGPGNVLINEWIGQHTGETMDRDGAYARKGKADEKVLSLLMQDPYFHQFPPKSLDRNYFHTDPVRHLSLEDGAATLAAFTVRSILAAQEYFPVPVNRWIVAGGGRLNPTVLEPLRHSLPDLSTAEDAGWEGDALEAQAFAFLAVRSYLGLPLSLPTTTGVNRAVTGGAFYRAAGGGP
jgi:anhydro-N-acetylmuramic acid kinase